MRLCDMLANKCKMVLTQPKLFRYELRLSVVALPISIILPHNRICWPISIIFFRIGENQVRTASYYCPENLHHENRTSKPTEGEVPPAGCAGVVCANKTNKKKTKWRAFLFVLLRIAGERGRLASLRLNLIWFATEGLLVCG